jgi:hypothetical protein
MSTKKKPSTQPNRLQQNTSKNEVKTDIPKQTEEIKSNETIYIPSVNAEKYPIKESSEIRYKVLAFKNDYIKLQEEVSKYLNEGWELAGGISTSTTVSPYESVTVFAQSIIKR